MNPWQFLGASLVGIYLAWIYYKSKNILVPILAHSIFNSIPLILTNFSPMEIEGLTKKSGELSLQPLWLDISGIILIIAGILLISLVIKKDASPR